MSYETFIEKQIQKAIAEGKFDNLEDQGKPINLDDYFAAPEDVRVGYSVLKSQKFVPEEVERLKEIGESKEKLQSCGNEEEQKKLTKVLNEKISLWRLFWKETNGNDKFSSLSVAFSDSLLC